MAEQSRPWWVDLTKEIGGLGLVLVMLIGLYILGDKHLDRMRQTWQDIKEIELIDLAEQRDHREQTVDTVQQFINTQGQRMNMLSDRLEGMDDRLDKLEANGK